MHKIQCVSILFPHYLQVRAWFRNVACFSQRADVQCKITSEKTVLGSEENPASQDNLLAAEHQHYLVEMERLCSIQDKLLNLKALLSCTDEDQSSSKDLLKEQTTIFVPIAELTEKSQ